MLNKLIYIGFAVNIVLSSIGMQVVLHSCVWCGGDRIEFIQHQDDDECTNSCCAKKMSHCHDCQHKDCCQPKLLKLTSGIAFGTGFDLSRVDAAPIVLDAICIENFGHTDGFRFVFADFNNRRGSPPFNPYTAFLSPLRC